MEEKESVSITCTYMYEAWVMVEKRAMESSKVNISATRDNHTKMLA